MQPEATEKSRSKLLSWPGLTSRIAISKTILRACPAFCEMRTHPVLCKLCRFGHPNPSHPSAMISQGDYRTRRLVDVKPRTRRVVAVRPKEPVLRAGLELSLL